MGLDVCLAPHRFPNLGADDGEPCPLPVPFSASERTAEDWNVRAQEIWVEDRVLDDEELTRRES